MRSELNMSESVICSKGIDVSCCPSTCAQCDIDHLVDTSPAPKQLATQLGMTITPPTADQSLICPKTNVPLMTCCELRQCEFWTDMDWTSNCTLAYMKHHKLETLKAEDISILLRMPLRKVGEILAVALAKLREEMVMSQEEKEGSKQFTFMPTREICCVCERPITRPPLVSLELPALKLAYCSKECKQAKPPRAIALEYKHGIDFILILEKTARKFRTITAMEQALGIDRWTIQDLLQKAKAMRGVQLPS